MKHNGALLAGYGFSTTQSRGKQLKAAPILPLTHGCAQGMRGRGVDYGRKRTGISAVVVVMGCSLVAQVAYAITQTKVDSGAGAHNIVAHHVQQPRHPMVMARSYEHRKPMHLRHFERTEHEEHAKHTRVKMAHQRGHRYFHRGRLRKHAVHHGEVEHVQRAQPVPEPWSTQTQGAPTWVLPQVCDQVLNYTGACQPAVLESLRVLGLQVPKVEDRGQMAQHLQSILDRQGLEQVQVQCQSVLLEDQRKINGLQTLLTRAHVVPSDDCSREIQNLTAQAIVAPASAPVPSASVATGASDAAQAPVAASGQ